MSEPESSTGARKWTSLPLFPPFLVAFPIISFFSANVNIVPVTNVARPLVVLLAVLAITWLVFGLLSKNWVRSGVFVTAWLVGQFGFGWVQSQTPPWVNYTTISVAYLLTITVVAIILTAVIRSAELLNVLGISAIGVAAVTTASHFVRSAAIHLNPPGKNQGSAPALQHTPDIYYIILDGYGRSDSIKKFIGWDNSVFVNGLKSEGFYVADQAHSNYCQTEQSIPSALNMDYVQNLLPPGHESESDRLVFSNLINKNRVEATLAKAGYATEAITTGFPSVRFDDADLQAATIGPGITLFESALIEQTPLFDKVGTRESMRIQRREWLLTAFNTLNAVGKNSEAPRLFLVHILAPHPPFVFDKNGLPLDPKGPFGYWDGNDFVGSLGTSEDYAKGYAAQAEFISKKTLEAVQSIKAKSSHPPIIIIQGDHGSKRFLNQSDMGKTNLDECFSNLNAYFVPQEIRAKLYPTITPVNSFRLVLTYLGVPGLEPLPDKSYWSAFAFPQKYTDVTTKLNSGPLN